VSIDLSAVNADWRGWVHLVSPIEPFDDTLGAGGSQYFNYYLRENWLAFRCIDNRYSLLGDFRYFQLENPAVGKGTHAILEKQYAEQQASYETIHARHLRHGGLYRFDPERKEGDDPYLNRKQLPLLNQLGGAAPGGNWENTDLPLVSEDGDNPRPLTEDGRPFQFIACATGYNYREDGADDILLFYDPQSKIALLTFDWT